MMAKAWAAQLDDNQANNQAQRRTRQGIAKAEQSRRRTAEIQAETAKIRRKIEASELRKAEAEQSLAAVLQEQAEIAAQIEVLAHRTDAVFARAEASFGAVRIQQERRAIADLAKQDQERAAWAEKAGQTHDPDLRAYFLVKAAGEDLDD